MQVSAGELGTGIEGVNLRCRHGPDRRPLGAIPSDQHAASQRGVAEGVGVDAKRVAGLVGARRPPREELVEAVRQLHCDGSRPAFVGQPGEREDRAVAGRHDIGAEPRSPHLHERRILPRGGLGLLNASMDREQRGSRHAVLEARPSGTPKRLGTGWQTLIERSDSSSVPEDLSAGQAERSPCHVNSLVWNRSAGNWRPRAGRQLEGSRRWYGTSATIVFRRVKSRSLSRRAVWLCSRFSHQWRGTNSESTTRTGLDGSCRCSTSR